MAQLGEHIDPYELGLYDYPDNVVDDFVGAERQLGEILPDAVIAAGNLTEILRAVPADKSSVTPETHANIVEAYERLSSVMPAVLTRLGVVSDFHEELPVALANGSGDIAEAFNNRDL